MARLISAQPKFKILVANIDGAGDPSRGLNPTKVRTGFQQQTFTEVGRGGTPSRVQDPRSPGLHTHQGLLTYTTPPVPGGSTGTVTVADNNFSDPAALYLGPYVLTSNEDYTPGGSTAATATALAAAIDALPDFAATAVGNDVNITGPFGPNGNDFRFEAIYRGSVQNFTLSPADGFLADGEPTIGPPEIL